MSMPSRSRTGSGPLIAGLLILIAVVVFVLVLLANNVSATDVWNSFFPVHNQVPATDRSLSTKSLYDFVFYIALVIFLLVEGLIIYSAFRFRRKPGDDELPPQIHGNNLVEIVWTLIPTVIVGVLFVFSWQTLNVVDATVKTDVHVRAVAARFQWSFEYLDGSAPDAPVLFEQVITTGKDEGLTLPVGVPITVDLRSKDVIHAFYVPMFLFKRDVVPGKLNTFDFTIDDPGTYRGQCAELCGSGHAAMLFDVNAVDKPTFDAWLQKHIDEAAATPPPPPSGGPSGAARCVGPAGRVGPAGWRGHDRPRRAEHRLHDGCPLGARQPAVHDQLRQPGHRGRA